MRVVYSVPEQSALDLAAETSLELLPVWYTHNVLRSGPPVDEGGRQIGAQQRQGEDHRFKSGNDVFPLHLP